MDVLVQRVLVPHQVCRAAAIRSLGSSPETAAPAAPPPSAAARPASNSHAASALSVFCPMPAPSKLAADAAHLREHQAGKHEGSVPLRRRPARRGDALEEVAQRRTAPLDVPPCGLLGGDRAVAAQVGADDAELVHHGVALQQQDFMRFVEGATLERGRERAVGEGDLEEQRVVLSARVGRSHFARTRIWPTPREKQASTRVSYSHSEAAQAVDCESPRMLSLRLSGLSLAAQDWQGQGGGRLLGVCEKHYFVRFVEKRCFLS